MNKTTKFILVFAAGSLLAIGLLAASFIGGMTFWRFRGAIQPVQAANLPLSGSAWIDNGQVAPQAGTQSTPAVPYSGSTSPTYPWQSGGMMGGWGNGWMQGGMMGGWNGHMPGGMMDRWWNNNGTQAPPPASGCWDCGMYGGGMMHGWGYPAGQSLVIPEPTPGADVSFQSDVLPIFQEDCVACHGGTAGLYLDSYANLMQGGRSGAVIVPGDPQASLLIQYVAGGYMPFRGQRLTDAEIQTLVNWVAAGTNDN